VSALYLASLGGETQRLWCDPEQLRRTSQIKPGFDPIDLRTEDWNLAI